MAYVSTQNSLLVFPNPLGLGDISTSSGPTLDDSPTFSALDYQLNMVGYVKWDDGGSTKTLSKVHFVPGAQASPVGTMTVGYQAVGTMNPPHAGDGTFIRSGTIDPSTFVDGTATSVTVSGTGTIDQRDLIAVCFKMTSYTSGTSTIKMIGAATGWQNPTVAMNTSIQNGLPNCLLEAADGSFGTLCGGGWAETVDTPLYGQTEEIGVCFSVPFNCKIRGFFAMFRGSNNSLTLDATVWGDPLGTPASILGGAPVALTHTDYGGSTAAPRPGIIDLGEELTLTADTVYAITLYNTSSVASNIETHEFAVPAAAHMTGIIGDGNKFTKITRSNYTGAFTEDTSTGVMIYPWISALDDGSGGSGGGVVTHPGMAGGMRG